jgi:phage terminase large subunit GpA-like protein
MAGSVRAMSEFVFSCPITGDAIDPGIEDAETNQAGAIRYTALYVRCPHCGEHHEIKIDDDTLNAAA